MRKLHVDGEMIDISAHLDELVEKLADLPELVAVYLFGSYGTEFQTPLSDVDLALLFRQDAVPDGREQIELIGLVTGTLREDDVSVTILNRAPLALQFNIIDEGRLLLVSDPVAHADFVEYVLDRFGDFAVDYDAFLEEYDRARLEESRRGAG